MLERKKKMRTLCGTILAAVAAFQAVAAIDCADVSVADIPRLAGETGDVEMYCFAIGNGKFL